MKTIVKCLLVWSVSAICGGQALICHARAARPPQHELQFIMKEKTDYDRTYLGTITMKGEYFVDESGTLFFVPNKQYVQDLPEFDQRSMIGFSNQAVAIDELEIKLTLKNVDLSKNCGVHGSAEISIKGLSVGDGPSNKWYTTEFLTTRSKSKALLVPCAHR